MSFLYYLAHVDKLLAKVIANNHHSVYGVLFIIIFAETGLVFLPFLPGDSLLFSAGALSSFQHNKLNVVYLFIILSLAAFLGNWLNYTLGCYFGEFIKNKLSKKYQRYLHDARIFYDKHGRSAVVIGRFIPIVRTFVPFVAGIANMSHKTFLVINFISALLWVGTLLFSGFFLSQSQWVQDHFTEMLYSIIFISVSPFIFAKLKSFKIFK